MREKYTRANVARDNPEHRAKCKARMDAYWNDPANAEHAAQTRAKALESRLRNLEARRTPEKLAIMKSMLADHKTLGDCAKAIGEPYGFVQDWAAREGLKSSPRKSAGVRARISASNKRTKALRRAAKYAASNVIHC
jgi:hypothetical protein